MCLERRRDRRLIKGQGVKKMCTPIGERCAARFKNPDRVLYRESREDQLFKSDRRHGGNFLPALQASRPPASRETKLPVVFVARELIMKQFEREGLEPLLGRRASAEFFYKSQDLAIKILGLKIRHSFQQFQRRVVRRKNMQVAARKRDGDAGIF